MARSDCLLFIIVFAVMFTDTHLTKDKRQAKGGGVGPLAAAKPSAWEKSESRLRAS